MTPPTLRSVVVEVRDDDADDADDASLSLQTQALLYLDIGGACDAYQAATADDVRRVRSHRRAWRRVGTDTGVADDDLLWFAEAGATAAPPTTADLATRHSDVLVCAADASSYVTRRGVLPRLLQHTAPIEATLPATFRVLDDLDLVRVAWRDGAVARFAVVTHGLGASVKRVLPNASVDTAATVLCSVVALAATCALLTV